MQKIKKIFLGTCLTVILFSSFNTASAQSLFGITDPPGCESKDIFLPNLLICGRSPSSGACQAYQKQCGLGDLAETGSRVLVWLITIVLLVVPLIIMYYGAKLMWYQQQAKAEMVKFVKERLTIIVLFFILMLSGWLIVRTVVDIFQVDERVPTFLIDENGNEVKARPFNTN
jgi:hypothetical protein